MSQSQAMFLWVCFTCSSKGHGSWLWLVVFNPYFFVAEKPLPMVQTCTIINFHNLHSLLGQFGFSTKGIKWQVLVCGKKYSFFREIQRENWRFLEEERAGSMFHVKSWLTTAPVFPLSFAVSSHIWLVAKQTFRKFSLVFTVLQERL